MPRKKKISGEQNKAADRRHDKFTGRLLGMKDWLSQDGIQFAALEDQARQFASLLGFLPVRTPILEAFDLFKKSTRRQDDKEFYFIDSEKSEHIVMRPEITQGLVRAYLENGLAEEARVTRLFSVGPIFRREKLQSGHYRESTQLDMEIIGDNKPLTEALMIALAQSFLLKLGIKVQVQINSLGTAENRREYCHKLAAFFKERGRRQPLCNLCKGNIPKNCLSLLDCQEEGCIKARAEAPQIADYLSPESREHFAKTLEFLDELDISYNFNPYLVRGLNYYNDTVFEFWPVNDNGDVIGKIALGAGGRFDSLVEGAGGPAMPAFGLAIGLERVFARIKDRASALGRQENDLIFIAQLGDQAKIKSWQLFESLREAGFNVRQSFAADSLKHQLEEASALHAKTSLILGRKEIMDGTILMRDMDSGVQETVVYKKIKERLSRKDRVVEKRVINRKEGGIYG